MSHPAFRFQVCCPCGPHSSYFRLWSLSLTRLFVFFCLCLLRLCLLRQILISGLCFLYTVLCSVQCCKTSDFPQICKNHGNIWYRVLVLYSILVKFTKVSFFLLPSSLFPFCRPYWTNIMGHGSLIRSFVKVLYFI